MLSNAQKRIVIQELNRNIDAYIKASKRYSPMAAEKLNEKVNLLQDIVKELLHEVKI